MAIQALSATRPARHLGGVIDSSTTLAHRLLLLAVALGWTFRIAHYAAKPAYWHDEALVVLNVIQKPAAQLVGRLDYAQAAPPLFLILERGLFRVFGASEYSLRLPSLLCGLAAVALFARLCQSLLPGVTAALATALFAFSDKLIWHSAEVKPYSGDAFCATLLLLLALRRPPTAGRLFQLSLLASLLVWFSFPVAIVFAAICLTNGLPLWRGGISNRLKLVASGAIFAASFLTLYFVSVRHQHVGYLSSFWADAFPPVEHPLRIPWWLTQALYGLCDHPYRSMGWLLAPLCIFGVAGWSKAGATASDRRVLLACLLTLAVALFAAALKQYPFAGDRITLYLTPIVFLLAAGAMRLDSSALTGGTPICTVLILVILARGIGEAAYRLIVPRTFSNARSVAAFVRAHREAGDGIYLVGEPEPDRPVYQSKLNLELLCYWTHPEPPLHLGMPADLKSISEQRFWLVFASTPKLGQRAAAPLLKALGPAASEVERFAPGPPVGFAILMHRHAAAATFPDRPGSQTEGK